MSPLPLAHALWLVCCRATGQATRPVPVATTTPTRKRQKEKTELQIAEGIVSMTLVIGVAAALFDAVV